jgi:hypothetical protein
MDIFTNITDTTTATTTVTTTTTTTTTTTNNNNKNNNKQNIGYFFVSALEKEKTESTMEYYLMLSLISTENVLIKGVTLHWSVNLFMTVCNTSTGRAIFF